MSIDPARDGSADRVRLILGHDVPCRSAILDLETGDVLGAPQAHLRPDHERPGRPVESQQQLWNVRARGEPTGPDNGKVPV